MYRKLNEKPFNIKFSVPKNERRYTITGDLPTVDAFQLMSWEDYDKKRKQEDQVGLEVLKKEYESSDRDVGYYAAFLNYPGGNGPYMYMPYFECLVTFGLKASLIMPRSVKLSFGILFSDSGGFCCCHDCHCRCRTHIPDYNFRSSCQIHLIIWWYECLQNVDALLILSLQL
jgi:hypothetical protein